MSFMGEMVSFFLKSTTQIMEEPKKIPPAKTSGFLAVSFIIPLRIRQAPGPVHPS
jgi:hypothetical protein